MMHRVPFRRAICGFATAALLVLASCRDAPRPPAAGETALDGHVRWLGDLHLEENRRVINVAPLVTLDPEGGFLVADWRENQIRAYGPDGRLLRYFGRGGSGPNEFTGLRGAMRLASGQVVAIDHQGKGAVFDSTGGTAIHTFIAPVWPLHSMLLLNDTLVLLGGKAVPRHGRSAEARLHLWNLARDTVVRSFFTPPIAGRAHTLAANVGGHVTASLRHDTLAAVFMASDTVYLYRLDGTKAGQIPIPSQHFRRLKETTSLPDHNSSIEEARRWIGTFSMMSQIFWLRDGGFLIQYEDRVGTTPHWRLLRMRRDGTRVFEVLDTPRLLAVDPRDDTLYFMKPGAITADTWSRARLKD